MRDFIVSIAIIVIVFTASYLSERYLTDTGNELVSQLNIIKDEIEEDRMEKLEVLKRY